MTPEAREWLDGLRQFAGPVASAADDPARIDPDAAAVRAAERAVLAAALVSWIDTDLPGLLAERSVPGGDPEPALVLTTTPAGLAAAADVLGRDDPLIRQWRERSAWVTEKDYRLWCIRHPDPDHRLHVNHWSWIKTQVPQQRHTEFAPHRLREGEAFWLHRTGTAGAGEADGRTASLWKFTGRHAALLEPRLTERRVPPPGA